MNVSDIVLFFFVEGHEVFFHYYSTRAEDELEEATTYVQLKLQSFDSFYQIEARRTFQFTKIYSWIEFKFHQFCII